MVGQFIHSFWRKSFIGDLRRARKISDDDSQWTIVYNGKAHQFEFVWLQGLCVKVGFLTAKHLFLFIRLVNKNTTDLSCWQKRNTYH